MASAYEVEARLAVEAEKRGDALAAVVRWGLAAHAAGTDIERVAAIAAAVRNAELALHQAVYKARTRDHRYPVSWRALASASGLPAATLNRRYRRKPSRQAPQPVEFAEREEVEGLMSADWEPDDEPTWHTAFDPSPWGRPRDRHGRTGRLPTDEGRA